MLTSYLSLFAISFFAATVIPLGSEWLLITLLLKSFNPISLVIIATIGNVLGGCATYFIGRYGSDFLTKKVLRINKKNQAKAERYYTKYGVWSLLLSWAPIIGDPLCLISGMFKTRFSLFLPLILIGKFARYAFIGFITLKAIE